MAASHTGFTSENATEKNEHRFARADDAAETAREKSYGLATGPGDQVIAVFSLTREQAGETANLPEKLHPSAVTASTKAVKMAINA